MTGEPAVMYVLVVVYVVVAVVVLAAMYAAAVATRWAVRYGPAVVRHLVATSHAERVAAVHARFGPPRRHGRRPTPGFQPARPRGT